MIIDCLYTNIKHIFYFENFDFLHVCVWKNVSKTAVWSSNAMMDLEWNKTFLLIFSAYYKFYWFCQLISDDLKGISFLIKSGRVRSYCFITTRQYATKKSETINNTFLRLSVALMSLLHTQQRSRKLRIYWNHRNAFERS